MKKIKYTKLGRSWLDYIKDRGYKYRLEEKYIHRTGIKHSGLARTDYVWLGQSGLLEIEKGYCWDGASGPTIDTESTMRASLVHDALYQLMREGMLPYSFRKRADELLEKIMREDGAHPIRAGYYYYAVRLFAGGCAKA